MEARDRIAYLRCLSSDLIEQSTFAVAVPFDMGTSYNVFVGNGRIAVLDINGVWRVVIANCSGTSDVQVLGNSDGFLLAACPHGRQGGILELDASQLAVVYIQGSGLFRKPVPFGSSQQIAELPCAFSCSVTGSVLQGYVYYSVLGQCGMQNAVYRCAANYSMAHIGVFMPAKYDQSLFISRKKHLTILQGRL